MQNRNELCLDENQIINLTATALEKSKHRVLRRCSTTECGVDLETVAPSGKRWLIETKGQTSARRSSARFGKPFTESQVAVHVSRAFYQAACLRNQYPESGIALAFPDEPSHQK